MSAIALLTALWNVFPSRDIMHQKFAEGTSMFGKPGWFVKKTVGWGIHPVTWQGWLYVTTWASIIGVPFVMLVSRQQIAEGLVWMGGTIGLLVWDVKQIHTHIDAPVKDDDEADIMYVVDQDDPSRLETEKFNMRLS